MLHQSRLSTGCMVAEEWAPVEWLAALWKGGETLLACQGQLRPISSGQLLERPRKARSPNFGEFNSRHKVGKINGTLGTCSVPVASWAQGA